MKDRYESPFSSRYASDYMLGLFSSDTRYKTWRRLWTALAEAEMKMGLGITEEQVEELRAHQEDIDYELVAKREKEVSHDVMAHVYAYGKAAPTAAGIIHLGATSCYVTDNADLVIYRDALVYIKNELRELMANLADQALKYKDVPTLGYTHYQPAQPVTVGKRISLWLQDLETDYYASFMDLFAGDTEKIDGMNRLIAEEFGFKKMFPVSGQTYPRKTDVRIMNCLSAIAQSCYRMAQDIRLLQHDRQIEEPFEKNQIGSSAMAYKRNPMRCERICSLARYLMTDTMNAVLTAQSQWLERTLDDSANRRVSLPEGFLCCDSILRIAKNVTQGIVVNEKVIDKTLRDYLPFIATENIMMQAVKKGGNRQEIHEIIRKCSMEATAAMKDGRDGELLKKLSEEPSLGLSYEELEELMDPRQYTGRCAEQVESYVNSLKPIIEGAGGTVEELNI